VLVSAPFRFVHSCYLFRHCNFLATTHDYNDFSYICSVYLVIRFSVPAPHEGKTSCVLASACSPGHARLAPVSFMLRIAFWQSVRAIYPYDVNAAHERLYWKAEGMDKQLPILLGIMVCGRPLVSVCCESKRKMYKTVVVCRASSTIGDGMAGEVVG